MTATWPLSNVPDPGVYPSMPAAVYHGLDAASNSRLSRLLRSPAHLKAYLAEPQKDTAALRIGRAVHSAILEPDDFDASFTTAGRCEALKKDGDRCSNGGTAFHSNLGWLCGIHTKGVPADFDQRRIVLSPADHVVCLGIRDSVFKHPAARIILAQLSEAELSVVWRDPETDVLCRARWDGYAPEVAGGLIVDVKSAKDARGREFARSSFEHGYHRQGAHYLNGAVVHELPVQHYVNIAVEKEPPYAVAVYRHTEDMIAAGRFQLRSLLASYAECLERDEWPAYSDDIQDISLPEWAAKQLERDMEVAA